MSVEVIDGKLVSSLKLAQKLEAANARLLRRQGVAKVRSYITPFPVSHFALVIPPDGIVMRYMFPGGGKISNACVYMEGDIKKGVTLSAHSKSITGIGVGMSANITKNFSKLKIDFSVAVGDRLEITLAPVEVPKVPIGNIWVAFLWIPNVNETDLKKFLQSEIAQLTDEE